jgi:predicted ATPase
MPTSQPTSGAPSEVRLKAGAMRSIHLRNLLSFGSAAVDLELRHLNVLVGPNGSGKSKVLEAIARLRSSVERVQLYREWTLGLDSVLRIPQKADLRTDRLQEDFSNLAMFLKRVCRQPKAKRAVTEGAAQPSLEAARQARAANRTEGPSV